MSLHSDLKAKIEAGDIVAGIIGLGYVGLPLAHSLCSKSIRTIGFDIDPGKAEKLNNGESYLDTVPPEHIKPHVDAKLFEATTDFGRLAEADFIMICVPTPLNQNREPDLSYIEKTTQSIAESLRPGQVIILESTTYPGTLDDVVAPILTEGGLREGQDFYLAYSPEREDPGNKKFETSTTPKIVGCNSDEGLEVAAAFYSLFISEVIPVSSAKTAEAVKITENIFRAVNIALVNELKVIYAKMGIDIWEVVEAAKSKPFGYMPFYPGPGLGGHCIPIDPFYLTWKAREIGLPTRFIELAGEINTAMPDYVVAQVAKALSKKSKKAINGSKLLMLGVAYKKNINDQRESPAFPIMKILAEQGASVDYHDAHIPEVLPMRQYPDMAGQKSVPLDADTLSSYDGVVIVTDHDGVDYASVVQNAQVIVDTRNALADYGDQDHIFKG